MSEYLIRYCLPFLVSNKLRGPHKHILVAEISDTKLWAILIRPHLVFFFSTGIQNNRSGRTLVIFIKFSEIRQRASELNVLNLDNRL